LLHLAVYRTRPDCSALVHVHSPWAVAVSCLPAMVGNFMPIYTGSFAAAVARL